MGKKDGARNCWCWYWPLLLLWVVQRPVALTVGRLMVVLLVTWVTVTFLADLSTNSTQPTAPSADLGLCQVLIVETDRASHLTTTQACAIESAAHHHSNHTVCLKTPAAEVWRAVGQLVRESSWFYAHMARLARYTWLWKYGGLVLDSDFLVLDSLLVINGSFVAMQSLSPENGISAAVIKLTRQHPLLLDWLDRAGHMYEPEDRGAWGDQLMTAVALDFCAEELELRGGREVGRKDDLSVLDSIECQSLLQVLPYSSFFPVSGNNWKEIFIAGSEEEKRVSSLAETAKAIHLWQDRSKVVQADNLRAESAFVKLSQEHCPMIYYREIHDTIPKKRKKLKPNEMKLILNWKLAGEAQGHFDSVKKKGKNDHLVDRRGQKKIHRVKVEQKDDYFEY